VLTLNVYSACMAAVFAHTFFTGTRLALVMTGLRLTESPGSVGVIMTAYALLPALLSPSIGREADKRGVRRLLNLGLLLLALSGAALWMLAGHLVVLVLAAAVVGFAFNCFAISIQKLIGDLPPTANQRDTPPAERRKKNFGTFATASSMSSLAGPLLAGWALDQLRSDAVFGLLASLPVVAWVVISTWQLPFSANKTASSQSKAPSPLLTKPLAPLFLVIVMLTFAGDALTFLTPIIGNSHGFSATTIGSIVSAFALGGFLVRLASGLFIAKLPEWTYLISALIACVLILLAYSQLPSVFAMSLLSFLLGACLGLAQPMTQSLLHRLVPADRVGEALGARLALVGAAQAAGPLVLGLGVDAFGTVPTLVLSCVVLGASGAYAAWCSSVSRAPSG
jgi:MFS family permease